jgi:hypothetical protein
MNSGVSVFSADDIGSWIPGGLDAGKQIRSVAAGEAREGKKDEDIERT